METTVKRHPIRGFLYGIVFGLGLMFIVIGQGIAALGTWPPFLVLLAGIVIGTLWATFGPAKKPKEPAPMVQAQSAPVPAAQAAVPQAAVPADVVAPQPASPQAARATQVSPPPAAPASEAAPPPQAEPEVAADEQPAPGDTASTFGDMIAGDEDPDQPTSI